MATAWKKSPDWLLAAFPALLPGDPRVEPRKMFGYPCAFANGNMFIGLHQDNLVLRLPEGERERFLAEHHSHIFAPFPNRPMREYVVVPRSLIERPRQLAPWVARALDYAAALPAKAKRRDGRGKKSPPAAGAKTGPKA
jgi:TfoX/Sxy family transcriptional regulator of competence genes